VKLREALRATRAALASEDISDAPLEGEVLLRHSLSLDRGQLYARLEQEVSNIQDTLGPLTKRRLAHEPLAYILGYREFYGLTLQINPYVLIPRQETELLVDKAIELMQTRLTQEVTIADIGTGSGAIAIALAKYLPKARILATDVSAQALQTAASNLRNHGLEHRVTLMQGDLLEPLKEPVDLLVANLPYVPAADMPTLKPELHYEPQIALDGGRDGLEIISRFLTQAPQHLKPGGATILEIDPRQSHEVLEMASKAFPSATVTIAQDLSRLDRAVIVQT